MPVEVFLFVFRAVSLTLIIGGIGMFTWSTFYYGRAGDTLREAAFKRELEKALHAQLQERV